MLPLTATLPKPMIAVGGRPFLEHLVEMLAAQGFERVLLLLGYLPDPIMEHFADGSRWGLGIEYSVTPVEDETGQRLRRAEHLLEDRFLLMYCDNYWPLRFADMWSQYTRSGARCQVTVYADPTGVVRNNVEVDDAGYVARYDKSRTEPSLNALDIGFLILPRDVVASLPAGNVSLERTLYPDLIARRQLGAFTTQHRYYSIGGLDRLPTTEQFLARHPTVLLDRDGVLNERMPRAEYVESWSDWRWTEGALDGLRRLHEAGYRVLVVTNQPGIARGRLSAEALREIHANMCAEAAAAGGEITRVYHCPHGWHDGCACRKPEPGMLFQAQHDYNLDLSRTFFIGDDERDRDAAIAAGAPFLKVGEGSSFADTVEQVLAVRNAG